MWRQNGDEFPFCAPNGKIIAVQSDLYGRNSEICLMGADGSGLKNWTDNPADDLYPYWSLDSKRIVFMSNRRGNHDIYIGSIDGSSLIQLTKNPDDDAFPSWFPHLIAFVSNRTGNPEIWVMNDDGSSNPIRLTISGLSINFVRPEPSRFTT